MKQYTGKAKKAIDLATRISKKLDYNYVGTEHILAGLIKEGTGVAAQVLSADGVDYDKLIQMIKDLISPGEGVAMAEKSRESNILEMLSQRGDSTLLIPTEPPYKINIPEQ